MAPEGGEGDIYNLNGVHIGNDGIDDKQVYLKYTYDDTQMNQFDALMETSSANGWGMMPNYLTTNVTKETGLTNDELNLRAALSTLKRAEAGSANEALEYNSWNNGATFTSDSYELNPSAYAKHPGTNTPYGSAAGAYQFLKKFYQEADFSPTSQDKAAVKNMTGQSYKDALSGNMGNFISSTKARWVSLEHWSTSSLQSVFNKYRADELTGQSNIAAPIGSLLRKK
jgi:muramidase (phage lysozyme)